MARYIGTSIGLKGWQSVTISDTEKMKVVCQMNCLDNNFDEMKELAREIINHLNKE